MARQAQTSDTVPVILPCYVRFLPMSPAAELTSAVAGALAATPPTCAVCRTRRGTACGRGWRRGAAARRWWRGLRNARRGLLSTWYAPLVLSRVPDSISRVGHRTFRHQSHCVFPNRPLGVENTDS